VADEDRHAHGGAGDLDLRIEHLLGFGQHLPFFLGVAVFHEVVDVRDDVEGDALGELLAGDRVGDEDGAGLVEQLVHAVLAAAGDRLIGGDDKTLDLGVIMQRLQRNDELCGGAVRIGDDVALGVAGDRVGFTSGTISGTSAS
jgi:hypothetical protein